MKSVENKMNPWKIGKLLRNYAIIGIPLGITLALLCENPRGYLSSKDFDNSPWKEFYNSNGRIWTTYKNEKIAHNQHNWDLYQKEVKEKNNGKLRGDIFLPDLDGNGCVGK